MCVCDYWNGCSLDNLVLSVQSCPMVKILGLSLFCPWFLMIILDFICWRNVERAFIGWVHDYYGFCPPLKLCYTCLWSSSCNSVLYYLKGPSILITFCSSRKEDNGAISLTSQESRAVLEALSECADCSESDAKVRNLCVT